MSDFAIHVLKVITIFFLTIGLVWFFAWTSNPSLDSDTVWFIAQVTGLIVTAPRISE